MKKILLQDALAALYAKAVEFDRNIVLTAKAGLELGNRTVAYTAFFAYGFDKLYVLKFDNQYCLEEDKYIEICREQDAENVSSEDTMELILHELQYDFENSIL